MDVERSQRVGMHVSAGFDFLTQSRPEDAAGEFLLAIKASGTTPDADALCGLAAAYAEGDFTPAQTLKAFEQAYPHNLNDWFFWSRYTGYLFSFYIDLETDTRATNARIQKDMRKHAEKQREKGEVELRRGLSLFERSIRERDFERTFKGAKFLVGKADWLDSIVLKVTQYGYTHTEEPLRHLAPPLYRAVATSNLEDLIPSSVLTEEESRQLREEVIGRARRQLALRGHDVESASVPIPNTSSNRVGCVCAWVGGSIAWLTLLNWVW